MPDTLQAAESGAQHFSEPSEIVEPALTGEAINQEAGEVFTYAHGDGQEFSGTLEQAREVCPALGRMSIESARATLQEEDLAARLAQRGREKREAESSQASESKRPQKPNTATEDSKKHQIVQTSHEDYIRSTGSTLLAETQDILMLQAESRAAVVPEPVSTERSKDTSSQPRTEEVQHLLIQQAEAETAPLSQIAHELREEPLETTGRAVVSPVESAERARVVIPAVVVAEAPQPARQPNVNIDRGIYESVEPPKVLPAIFEESVQPVFIEHITEPDEARLAIDPQPVLDVRPNIDSGIGSEPAQEYVVDVVEQNEMEIGPAEPLYEIVAEQLSVEPVQPDMAEAGEPVGPPENVMDYELLEEDDVVSLLAGFEQSRVEVDENGEPLLVEVITAESAETEEAGFIPVEFQAKISVPELSAPVVEIETAITHLAEAMEAEPEESLEIHQILEEIMILPENTEPAAGEAAEAVEQKLEELFVRLFEATDIDYTPALLQSFVTLTQAHYLEELLPDLTDKEEETQSLPDEIGTREFLQKLQNGLSSMKQAAIHFYEIGRSVLRLYTLGSPLPQLST